MTPEDIKRELLELNIFKYIDKVETVEEGVSTNVFRIFSDSSVFYLRIQQQENIKALISEIEIYNLLNEQKVKVPEVIYYETDSGRFGSPYMIVTEIKGEPLYTKDQNIKRKVLNKAGEDLAIINSFKVNGFSWIESINEEIIIANYKTYQDFHFSGLEKRFNSIINEGLLNGKSSQYINKINTSNKVFSEYTTGHLAHGDFDISSVYYSDDTYTGIIDFGDVRVGSIYYDLAHNYLYDGEESLKYLLEGYLNVTKLDDNYMEHIRSEALFIAVGKFSWIIKNIPKSNWNNIEINYINNFFINI
ncbi:MAG: aminoglycoside phosphotransferase family protein [Candidatus Dojkabacteria bacterium]|nr:aminoglycoside phosphotransferase family protein [Candidatus Dojkabacteria bacterium]MDQ7021134.1 aminoglycoside phosphotransferase family protein [Candidatus Dojkabacteria bacterium]